MPDRLPEFAPNLPAIGGSGKSRSLDPEDWDEFRALAHAMLNRAIDHLEDVRERPVWQAVPQPVKAAMTEPIPMEPQGAASVCRDLADWILPYSTGNTHPRFFGWVHGTGTPGGIIAEMMAAAVNANCGGRDHAAVYIERQVVDWFRTLFRFPAAASGLVVSGTSMATLIALTVARNKAAGADIRRTGLAGTEQRLVAYASAEAHGSVDKAMEILGLGRDALRCIPADPDGRMDVAALRSAIAGDRNRGMMPFAVIATAGTVNIGAVDPLPEIADLCAQEEVWLHVDGAFGALAVLSDTDRQKVAGIERADSLAFDFHKWLHVPYDAGMVLIRDGALHQAAFGAKQDYLAPARHGLAAGEPWFCEFGPELSRGFSALKVWFTMKEHGMTRLGEAIAMNCRQAERLADMIGEHHHLEIMAPVALNIVCFRYLETALEATALDRLNERIVIALHEQGIAAPSTTRLGGRLAIRVNITNHRTGYGDLKILLDAVLDIGANIVAGESTESVS
jgi:glutamate/tyrosine decarboxylase-like PLP-dependent enzyme